MTELPLTRDCFVTSITLAFLRKAGQEALEWDPLIVRDAFEGIFHVEKMPQRMFDKLNCGLTLIGTSSYTDTIEGFLMGTACMNNLVIDGDTAPFCTLRHCAWGVWEYANLNGDIDRNSRPTEKFSPDIIKYIQEAGKMNGVTRFPVWLDFASLPEGAQPDLSDDLTLFETYNSRQDEYVEGLNVFVTDRQNALTAELEALEKLGFIG